MCGYGGLRFKRICGFWSLESFQKKGEGSREKRLDLWLKRGGKKKRKKEIELFNM